jgi:hypothetical protein
VTTDGDGESSADWVRLGTPEWTREQHKDYLITALFKGEHELDNLAVVVVGGTVFEYYLRRLIATKANMNVLEPNERAPVPFAMLVRIAKSIDVLTEPLAKPLTVFMSLRNRYAHEIAYQLTDADIQKLRASVADTWMEDDWEQFQVGPPDLPGPSKRTPSFHLRVFIVCVADSLLEYLDVISGRKKATAADLGFEG